MSPAEYVGQCKVLNIICQWSKNFRKCMEQFPPEMQIPDSIHVDVAIPGWHINGHGDACRNNFNLSYMKGVGRTVGEDIETTWVGTNPLAASVRKMGPAADARLRRWRQKPN